MNDAAHPLNRAYNLIEKGDLEAAQDVLETIRDDHTDNPDFWWVYAHAVEDETEGQEALQRVRDLAPGYPGLENLSQQKEIVSEPSRINNLAPKADQPPQPPDLPRDDDFDEFDDFVDNLDEQEAEVEGTSGSNRTRLLALIAVVLLVIIGLALILNSGDDQSDVVNVTPSDEPTEAVAFATEVVTDVPTMSPVERLTAAAETETPESEATEPVSDFTEEPGEATATVSDSTEEPGEATATVSDSTEEPDESVESQSVDPLTLDELTDILADFDVPDDGATTDETTLGNTLIVTICTAPGPQASSTIEDIFDALAGQESRLASDIEAIGFGITDCNTDTTRQTIGVERTVLQSYADDDITLQDVQRQLRPLR
jgi:cytoskeletal protein RodZ